MRLFFGTVIWVMFCMWMGMLFYGCSPGTRLATWERCATYSNQECRDMEFLQDELDCEYVYYKECIGE